MNSKDSIECGNKSSANARKFVCEFVNVFDNLAQKYNSRLWWATDLASKNRFTSKVSSLLQKRDGSSQDKLVLKDYLIWVKSKLNIIVQGMRFYYRAVLAKKSLKKYKNSVLKDCYVIKTFIYNNSFKNGYRDSFFGELPEYLKGKENIVIFANILGDYTYCLKQIEKCEEYVIVPIELFVTFRDVLKAIFKLLFSDLTIREHVCFLGKEIQNVINNELFKSANGIQIYQYLHYEATEKFLERFKTKCFLQTYENNPWERMCILAVRENCPKAKIIGFQHTVVPQASLNVFVGDQEFRNSPLPDKVLTVGKIPKDILTEYGGYEEGFVQPACALRHEYLSDLGAFPQKKEKKILIALEGVPAVDEMVRYVIDQLGGNENFQIKIRTHPVLPWSYFKSKCNIDITKKGNILISNNTSLLEDLKWADIVVYWGSTVVLEALKVGRPAIHFDNGALLSFDPLFQCSDLKWVVSKGNSLLDVIEDIYSLSQKDFKSLQQNALEYVNQYFWAINKENLALFESKNLFAQNGPIV